MGRRRVWGVIASAMVALAVLPVDGISGAEDTAGVSVQKSGWWSQSNTGVNTPNGAITPPIPRSPFVPNGSLPVTATLGQPQNISAIGFAVPDGMQASSLTLTLPPAEGGDQNASAAKIAACVITAYWDGSDNAKWEAKPQWDCAKAKASGTRNDDGSFTFDLSSIAMLWADPFETIPADNGVALVPDPDDATGTFQVTFAKDKITTEATLSEATSSDSSFTVDVSEQTIPTGTPTFSEGSVDTGPLPAPSASGGGSPEASRGSTGGGTRIAADRQHDVGNIGGNLPLGMLLLIPIVLVVAVLAGQSVSSRGARPEHARRQGGVGRALAARATQSVRPSRPEMP